MRSADPFVQALQTWSNIVMHRAIDSLLLYSKQSGLSMSQLKALYQINHHGHCGVSGLGEDLGVTSAAASQLLDRLVHLRLILRSENPQDRRGKQIVLTDEGRQTLHASQRQRWLDDLARTLSPAEKEQITAALSILIDKANQLEQPPVLEH